MRDTFSDHLIKGNLGIYAEEPGTFKRDIASMGMSNIVKGE